jgi:hypothetical protein
MDEATTTDDWSDPIKKIGAVYNLLRYLAKNPQEGLNRVGKDDDAKDLFEKKGGITVPVAQGARVIFFTPDEGKDHPLGVGSSVIIRVPPVGFDGNATDQQLQEACVLGNYPYWPPILSTPPTPPPA